jgi:hypothetical protein
MEPHYTNRLYKIQGDESREVDDERTERDYLVKGDYALQPIAYSSSKKKNIIERLIHTHIYCEVLA